MTCTACPLLKPKCPALLIICNEWQMQHYLGSNTRCTLLLRPRPSVILCVSVHVCVRVPVCMCLSVYSCPPLRLLIISPNNQSNKSYCILVSVYEHTRNLVCEFQINKMILFYGNTSTCFHLTYVALVHT